MHEVTVTSHAQLYNLTLLLDPIRPLYVTIRLTPSFTCPQTSAPLHPVTLLILLLYLLI